MELINNKSFVNGKMKTISQVKGTMQYTVCKIAKDERGYHVVTRRGIDNYFMVGGWYAIRLGKKNKDYKTFKTVKGAVNFANKLIKKVYA